jgi:hypothetical protein
MQPGKDDPKDVPSPKLPFLPHVVGTPVANVRLALYHALHTGQGAVSRTRQLAYLREIHRMILRRLGAVVALLAAALLAGCAAPQQPIDLASDYFSSGKARQGRLGVVMADLPKPDTQFPGASCLLCIAVANAAHSALSKEVQGFSTAELKPLPGQLVELLRKQGVDAILLSDPLKLADLPDLRASDPKNKPRKNFSGLKAKHQLDRLLLVEITSLGVSRSYSAYIPSDVPRAMLNGSASLIDLNTNALEWYMPLALSRAAEGPWDEPKFPGLTNAYFQVLETGMDMVKKPFTQ